MVSAFTRNDTYAAIRTGRYNNLFTFVQGDYTNGGAARDAWIVPAADGGDCRHSPNPTPAGGITWCPILPIVLQPSPNTNQKGSYSAADFVPATCLYTGISLTDMLIAAGEAPPPIGLFANPQGGTTIEAWLPLEVASGCVNATCLCEWPTPGWTNCPIYQPLNASCSNGDSYHAKSQSLFNMTVKAMLWYQGENNMMFDAGTAQSNTGYTCMIQTLISHYRKMWSVEPDTTDPALPFYIVGLHDGAEEGWGGMAAAMFYAHTAGYGTLPNPLLPNTYLAAAHDAGDAWDGGEECATNLCCVGTGFPLGPTCQGDFRGQWTNDTVDAGGILHPRGKDVPGARLAQAMFAAQYASAGSPVLATGPVIAGCTVAGGSLTLSFDAALLKGERVTVSKPPLSDPLSLTLENTALYVLVNATLPEFDGHNPCNYATGVCFPADYHYKGPFSTGNELGVEGWVAVMPVAGPASNEVTVDLAPLRGQVPTAVRYALGAGSGAWQPGASNNGPGCQRTCCGLGQDCALKPCPAGSCPIKASGAGELPAVPFRAAIVGNKCKCVPPQVCDA